MRFDTPDAAVACAVALHRKMGDTRAGGAFVPELRVGIHAGEAVADDNDLVGRVINLAARVTDAAEPGEILITEPVADHLSPGVALVDRGLKPLKGFAQPRHLLAVVWHPTDETIVLTTRTGRESDDGQVRHLAVWPSPCTTYFNVVSSRRPIGPRACSFCVEMPISAPKPNSSPSTNRVDAFTSTAAASTSWQKRSAAARSRVTIASE